MMQSTFVGWDFDDVWQIDEGYSYPYLIRPSQQPEPGFGLTVTQNNEYMVIVSAKNITSFYGETITIEYNPVKLQLLDTAAQVSGTHLSQGAIQGTGITIISTSYDSVSLTFNRTIPLGKTWSGAITVLKFKALVSGATVITIS